MNKNALVKNFSKNAKTYDAYTGIQNRAAVILADILPAANADNILEIGCGTGNYTALLRKRFGSSHIKAIDISEAMVAVAKEKKCPGKTDFMVQDAETMSFDRPYDLITSNAVFHWFGDLENIIKKSALALSDNGILVFSSFGPGTFTELRTSLRAATGENSGIASDSFPVKQRIEETLKKYFGKVRIDEKFIKETYPSVEALLKKIKYSGTAGVVSGLRRVWSPGLLERIEKEYFKRFGSVEATYQIFFCKAAQ
jgi:malonyl-CoA O-methyltransferase